MAMVAMRQNPSLLSNPAWTTRLLGRNFEQLEREVPAKWLPRLDHVKATGRGITGRPDELGCGMYGCVFPTLDKSTVMKLTTDSTEFEFASKLSAKLAVPCVVKYFAAMKLNAKHDGRDVFLLWREEATDIGKIKGAAEQYLNRQHERAQRAYELVVEAPESSLDALEEWAQSVKDMERSSELAYLSRGLIANYKKLGVFIGDIHPGNIGKVSRGGKLQWVVSDPGHTAVVAKS